MTRNVAELSPHKYLAEQRELLQSLARRPAPKGSARLHIKVVSDFHTVVAGDGKFVFEIPREMNAMVLTQVESYVTTVSTSGKPTIQLRKVGGADMLSTKCEIDANEKNSKDAAIQPVINTATDDVAWGDHIAIDVDVAGTGAKGLGVILTFIP